MKTSKTQQSAQTSPWISVHDETPEIWPVLGNRSFDVLVHFHKKGSRRGLVSRGYFCGGHRWQALIMDVDGVYRYIDVDVDLWMPFPSIPEGGAL